MNTVVHSVDAYLGLHAPAADLTFAQISLRGIIVFIVTLAMVRIGDKRFLSKKTAFDAILGFILASMLARAVNGTASFFPTLGAGFVLVGLHRLLGRLAQHRHRFGNLIKGHAHLVVENGVVKEDIMRKHHLSEHDLLEDLRMNGNINDPAQVRQAFLERNGQISVVK